MGHKEVVQYFKNEELLDMLHRANPIFVCLNLVWYKNDQIQSFEWLQYGMCRIIQPAYKNMICWYNYLEIQSFACLARI
jgi:hypothetical protein